jgi:hypothetical protein
MERMQGQKDVQELARAAFSALEEAELGEALEQVHDRVFRRDCSRLFETTTESGALQCRFNPIVELLLRHITDIAGQETLTQHQRHQEIAWALDMCGF